MKSPMATRAILFSLLLATPTLGWVIKQAGQGPFKVKGMTEEGMLKYETMVKKMQKESMGMPDPKVGEMIAAMGPDDPHNPEEMGTYMEGDMLHMMDMGDPDPNMRFKWPDGIVYYTLDGDFSRENRALIQQAIEEYHKHTCIKFRPYTGREKDYISIEKRRAGCFSDVGRTGGKQVLNLQSPGCLYKVGTAIHELMHALGFFHEQSRADRDDAVDIKWQNIENDKQHNFKLHKSYTGFGIGYDYGSVMHYGTTAFSKNRQTTIDPKRRSNDKIGQREGFSKRDIEKVNNLYCSESGGTKTSKYPVRPEQPERPGVYLAKVRVGADREKDEIVEKLSSISTDSIRRVFGQAVASVWGKFLNLLGEENNNIERNSI